MVRIVKLNWLSQETKEAEVLLSDGDFDLICFSHPFTGSIGNKIAQPLHILNAREIVELINDDEKKFLVKKEKDSFSYKLKGMVINKNQIRIGKFILELDIPLTNDFDNGTYVSFACDRIDIW